MRRPSTDVTARARQIVAAMQERVALAEGAGVLQGWEHSSSRQAQRNLRDRHGEHGQNTEAARMIAVVNANAAQGTDPDWNDEPK